MKKRLRKVVVMNLKDVLDEIDKENNQDIIKAINFLVRSLFNVAVVSKLLNKKERENVYKLCRITLKSMDIPEEKIDKFISEYETSCINFHKILE